VEARHRRQQGALSARPWRGRALRARGENVSGEGEASEEGVR
jgi:hypothetical protein